MNLRQQLFARNLPLPSDARCVRCTHTVRARSWRNGFVCSAVAKCGVLAQVLASFILELSVTVTSGAVDQPSLAVTTAPNRADIAVVRPCSVHRRGAEMALFTWQARSTNSTLTYAMYMTGRTRVITVLALPLTCFILVHTACTYCAVLLARKVLVLSLRAL